MKSQRYNGNKKERKGNDGGGCQEMNSRDKEKKRWGNEVGMEGRKCFI